MKILQRYIGTKPSDIGCGDYLTMQQRCADEVLALGTGVVGIRSLGNKRKAPNKAKPHQRRVKKSDGSFFANWDAVIKKIKL